MKHKDTKLVVPTMRTKALSKDRYSPADCSLTFKNCADVSVVTASAAMPKTMTKPQIRSQKSTQYKVNDGQIIRAASRMLNLSPQPNETTIKP